MLHILFELKKVSVEWLSNSTNHFTITMNVITVFSGLQIITSNINKRELNLKKLFLLLLNTLMININNLIIFYNINNRNTNLYVISYFIL